MIIFLIILGLSILELSKILMYEFWYDCVNQNMVKNQNCIILIQTYGFIVYIKQIKTLQKMFKQGLTLQTMNYTEKIRWIKRKNL